MENGIFVAGAAPSDNIQYEFDEATEDLVIRISLKKSGAFKNGKPSYACSRGPRHFEVPGKHKGWVGLNVGKTV